MVTHSLYFGDFKAPRHAFGYDWELAKRSVFPVGSFTARVIGRFFDAESAPFPPVKPHVVTVERVGELYKYGVVITSLSIDQMPPSVLTAQLDIPAPGTATRPVIVEYQNQ